MKVTGLIKETIIIINQEIIPILQDIILQGHRQEIILHIVTVHQIETPHLPQDHPAAAEEVVEAGVVQAGDNRI